jgi:hypothetical protein
MDQILRWLLSGDIAIQYLTHKHLLHSGPEILAPLQARIATEGYGARYLAARSENGHWGHWFYQPKWTSTHYTLLDLKEIGMPPDTPAPREMVVRAFNECMLENGGINFSKTMVQSDAAVDGMILNYAAYFCPDEQRVEDLAGYILAQVKPDGGYSWDDKTSASDPHTTICVLEGFHEYKQAGFTRHREALHASEKSAIEYLLSNQLFMSGDKRFLKLSHPFRYRYDLLRVLEYFASEKAPMDERMAPALDWLRAKQKESGFWQLENIHKGNLHFEIEKVGEPSRFITLKALSILKNYTETRTKPVK